MTMLDRLRFRDRWQLEIHQQEFFIYYWNPEDAEFLEMGPCRTRHLAADIAEYLLELDLYNRGWCFKYESPTLEYKTAKTQELTPEQHKEILLRCIR